MLNNINIIYNIFIIVIGIFIICILYYRELYLINNSFKLELLLTNNEIQSKYIIDRKNDNEYINILKNIKQNDINTKNIVLITSKIIITNPNYISKYNSDVRFNQTIETIESIKKYIKDVYIILIDNSNFNNKIDYLDKLKLHSDMVINPFNNVELIKYTNMNSSIGETYQIIYFLDILKELNIKFSQLFKISGRYLINDNFNYNLYKSNKIIFTNIPVYFYEKKFYRTSIYKISSTYINIYINAYKQIHKNIKNNKLYKNWLIENIIPYVIDNKYIKYEEIQGITMRYTGGRIEYG